MKKDEIRVGGYYYAKVGGRVTTVLVTAITETEGRSYNTTLGTRRRQAATTYSVTNTATGRKTRFRSAAKFRGVAPAPGTNPRKPAVVGPHGDEVDPMRPETPPAMEATECDQTPACKSHELDPGEQCPECGGIVPNPTTPAAPSAAAVTIAATNGTGGEQGRPPTLAARTTVTVRRVAVPSVPARPAVATVVPPSSATPGSPKPGTLAAALAKPTDTAPHMEVQALAGTGKTWTAVQGLIVAKGGTSNFPPSEQQAAVWEQLKAGRMDSVRVSAYNTSITNEMKARLNAAGLDKQGVEGRGVHSLGLQSVTKAFGRLEASTYTVLDHVADALGGNYRDLQKEPGMATTMKAVDELVGLCKQTLTDPTEEGLDALCSRYDVELEDQRQRVYDLVPSVLERCKTPKGRIHFDDMVWLPLVLDLPVARVDLQIIDEAQDLNRMQQELIKRAGHRIVFIGDRHQAIYGFAGADSESMARLAKDLGDDYIKGPSNDARIPHVLRGCVTLPLTVTYRCGKAIVQEARRYVPEFEAHHGNAEGIVRSAKYPIRERYNQVNGGERERVELPWEETYGPQVQPGDFVLCRVNAPNVKECFRFLKRGLKASILGKKIGEGLVSLITKSKQDTVPDLVAWLDDWRAEEEAKENAKRMPSESRLELLGDKYDCVMTFTEGSRSTSDVIGKIRSVFADKHCPKCKKSYKTEDLVCSNPACREEPLVLPPGVRFSSIHKSKGLEAGRVFFLKPPFCGPRRDKMQPWEQEQEDNLQYVAITRAISELVYVA